MELYEARKTFLYTFLGKDYPSPILFERVLFCCQQIEMSYVVANELSTCEM